MRALGLATAWLVLSACEERIPLHVPQGGAAAMLEVEGDAPAALALEALARRRLEAFGIEATVRSAGDRRLSVSLQSGDLLALERVIDVLSRPTQFELAPVLHGEAFFEQLRPRLPAGVQVTSFDLSSGRIWTLTAPDRRALESLSAPVGQRLALLETDRRTLAFLLSSETVREPAWSHVQVDEEDGWPRVTLKTREALALPPGPIAFLIDGRIRALPLLREGEAGQRLVILPSPVVEDRALVRHQAEQLAALIKVSELSGKVRVLQRAALPPP